MSHPLTEELYHSSHTVEMTEGLWGRRESVIVVAETSSEGLEQNMANDSVPLHFRFIQILLFIKLLGSVKYENHHFYLSGLGSFRTNTLMMELVKAFIIHHYCSTFTICQAKPKFSLLILRT